MGKASREKGKRGEREFASLCREYGYAARRGQQYSGVEGDDVIGLPGIHAEDKRVERLNLRAAVAQSCRDAAEGAAPIVAHRRNHGDWLVTMRARDWFALYGAYAAAQAEKEE